jgi:hypothetical protein
MHDNGRYVNLEFDSTVGLSTPAGARDQKNSPSRFPFRPPFSLTFPLRVLPSNSASTYSGSVLGARSNLGALPVPIKGLEPRRVRNLRKFNYPHFHSRACSLWITTRRRRGDRVRAVHLRAPAISRGVVSFLWALVFFLYIWWGGVAVGVHGATAFIFGAVVGFLVFLAVMVYGVDEPQRQPRRADRR